MHVPIKVKIRTLNGLAVECGSDFINGFSYAIVLLAGLN